LNMEIT